MEAREAQREEGAAGAREGVLGPRLFSTLARSPGAARPGSKGALAKALDHTLAFGWSQEPLVVLWCAISISCTMQEVDKDLWE